MQGLNRVAKHLLYKPNMYEALIAKLGLQIILKIGLIFFLFVPYHPLCTDM